MSPRLDPMDYTRASALVLHATLIRTIEASYPDLTMELQNAMVVDILDQTARMRGWSLRPEPKMREDDHGE